MLGSEIPSIKQLINIKLKRKKTYFNKENLIWTSQTAVSIKLIIKAYKKISKKEKISIWIPDYFCAETINFFKNESMKICYYPIGNDFEPNWRIIKEDMKDSEVDIFLFVHYFGVYRDISKTLTFCKQKNALLIEDCAHCLFDYEKIGKKGDFTLYSPHKILPVPSGGIIINNVLNEKNKLIFENIKELNQKELKGRALFWRVKKLVQKITKIHRKIEFVIETHYEDVSKNNRNSKEINIDKWSYSILQTYDYERLKRIAYIRRMNLKVMNYIVKNLNPNIKPLISEETFCPYYAVYSLENIKDVEKQNEIEILKNKGLLVMYWPDLPLEIKELKTSSIAKNISKNIIVIPIHQGINSQRMMKKTLNKLRKKERTYSFVELCKNNLKDWDGICNKKNNIPQDRIYGKIRADYSNDNIKNYLVIKNKEIIGKLQAIELKKLGIKYGVRVNRGPIEKESIDNKQYIFEIMESFKKLQGIYPILWSPNIENTPENLYLACAYNWKRWNLFGFPSGLIYLEKSEEEIRKNLEGKWRNQLKTSEKKCYIVKSDNSRYKEILNLYLIDQKEKNFQGVPHEILVKLFETNPSPLIIYYIEKENKILAFNIIYLQKEIAHYLVGWNSLEGRKDYLNNLLLFNITISLKEKGLLYFDLGGIEYLSTEEIAKFKDGMKPEHYHLLGEFIKY